MFIIHYHLLFYGSLKTTTHLFFLIWLEPAFLLFCTSCPLDTDINFKRGALSKALSKVETTLSFH